MALGQVARRVAIMESEHPDLTTVHLHFWQRVNPVVTEVLSQLISGTPQVLYNGGLPFSAVAYRDADRDRPGLPADVAALVTGLEDDRIDLELVNLSMTQRRRIFVSASRFGERRISGIVTTGEHGGVHPGPSTAYADTPGTPFAESVVLDDGPLPVDLPPSHRARLTLQTTPSRARPAHSRPVTAYDGALR